MKKGLSSFVMLILVISFGWGIYFYRDAPLSPCGDGEYCGKFGDKRTIQQYEGYKKWEKSMFVLFPFGILLIAYLNKKK